MNCPKCDAAMEPVTFATVEVDRCPQCQGLWFDEGEAEQLKSAKGAGKLDAGQPLMAAAAQGPQKVLCPRCRTPMIGMVVHGQAHIRYESCKVCHGSFFDAGEFKDMTENTILERIRAVLRRL